MIFFIIAGYDSLKKDIFVVIEGETKTIMGFECKKAISSDKKKTAWFTPFIAIADEPISSGLPGLILELDSGQQTYIAIKIDDNIKQQISKPTGGKEMSKESFDKMVKQRVEMMKRGNVSL